MARKIVVGNPQFSRLRVGDRIRIIEVPGLGIPDYSIHPDTVRLYRRLISRGRSVRIQTIDRRGARWFQCRFRRRNGQWERHWLAVAAFDNNWIEVKPRSRDKHVR